MLCESCKKIEKCEKCGTEIPSHSFSIWKTIKLGTEKDLEKALTAKGIKISEYAKDLLKQTDISEMETTVDLVRVTVGELFGDTDTHTTDQIYEKARSLGLDICPSKVGPQLRLQYLDQSKGEYLIIGMKQITDSDGDPSVFYLRHDDDGVWLDDAWAGPAREWRPGLTFVFRLRK